MEQDTVSGNSVGGGIGDAARRKAARFADIDACITIMPLSDEPEVDGEAFVEAAPERGDGAPGNDGGLGAAIAAKRRDNLVLGETLVDFGLIDQGELSAVALAQNRKDDVVESLMAASAIRTRLGDILHRSQQITSAELEGALETQRLHGGLLGEILVSMGALSQDALDDALATQARQNARGVRQ